MKRNIMSLLSVIIFVLFASCDDMGGNTEPFTTVSVFATFEENAYSSDVTVKIDTSDPANDVCDSLSYFDDDIDLTITSTSIDNLSDDVIPSDVKVMSYTVEFTAREDDSPDVPTKSIRHELLIDPDSETDIPIRIIDIEDKWADSTHPLNYTDYFFGTAAQYEYTLTVRLKMEEVLSGREETVKVEFPLYYYDITDECSGTVLP